MAKIVLRKKKRDNRDVLTLSSVERSLFGNLSLAGNVLSNDEFKFGVLFHRSLLTKQVPLLQNRIE